MFARRMSSLTKAIAITTGLTGVASPLWAAETGKQATPSSEEMWRIIQQQQQTIQELKGQLDSTEQTVQETEDKVEQTELKVNLAADQIEEFESGGNLGNWADKVQVGGYGSFRGEVSNLNNQNDTFTFRRFVLTVDAKPTERLQTYLELELERFAELELEKELESEDNKFEAEQVVEGTSGSELAVEQAWAKYRISDALNFQAGSILVPLGRFNLNHDDNQWNLTRRSLVDTGVPVIPSGAAWPELGVGILGTINLAGDALLDYRLYAMNGAQLDLEFEQKAESVREDGEVFTENVFLAEFEPTQGSASTDLNDNKALSGRIALRPAPGQEIALSGYWGRYTPGFLKDEDVLSVALDGLFTFGDTELEYQAVHTDWGDVDALAANFAQVIPLLEGKIEPNPANGIGVEVKTEFELSGLSDSRSGYWVELRHTLKPDWLKNSFLGDGFPGATLEPTARLEQVFFNGIGGAKNQSVNRATLGLAYRPTPSWAFSLAGEYTWTDEQSLDGLTNFISAGSGEDNAFALTAGVSFGF